MKTGVQGRFEFMTPDLPQGSFKYRITVIHSSDSTKGKDFDIEGVTAGKIIAVDLRSAG